MSEEQLVDVSAVNESFIATARPDVVVVEIDGEMVLYDDRSKAMHRLSPTAGQVWRCLDGSGSLAEIAADLAEVYQVDPEQVLTDVVGTARQFGSAGLLLGVGGPPEAEEAVDQPEHSEWEHPDSPFVSEPAASGMDGSFPLGDAGSLTVRVGPYLLGVRFSTPELVDMAREVLAPSLVQGVVAPPNVSVKVTQARGGRPLLYCYRSTMLVTRARSPQRALQAAASLLSTYVLRDHVRARVAALSAVRSGVMALFCPESWMVAARLVPRLRAAGWEVLDAPEVDLDSEGRVVVSPCALTLDAAALARLPASRFEGTRPAPGRYPVAAWVALAGPDPAPESMAGRVARVAADIPNLDAESAPSVFDATAAMLQGTAWAVSPTIAPNDLAATLADAVAT